MKKKEKDLIDEIHEWRTQMLAEHDNDFHKYCAYLKEQEKKYSDRIVDQIVYRKRGDTSPK